MSPCPGWILVPPRGEERVQVKKGRRWQQRTPTPHMSSSTPVPPQSFAAQKGSEATSFLPAHLCPSLKQALQVSALHTRQTQKPEARSLRKQQLAVGLGGGGAPPAAGVPPLHKALVPPLQPSPAQIPLAFQKNPLSFHCFLQLDPLLPLQTYIQVRGRKSSDLTWHSGTFWQDVP